MIVNSDNTPDSLIFEYFRGNKSLGSKDRRMVSEVIYSALRLFKYLDKSYKLEEHIEITLLLLKNFKNELISDDSLNYKFLDKIKDDTLFSYSSFLESSAKDIIELFKTEYYSDDFYLSILPSVLIKNCDTNLNELAKSLLLSSDIYIWIADKNKSSFVIDEFKGMNTDLEKSDYLPYSFKLNKRANINNSKSFKKGVIEVQGLASQLVAHFVSPQANEYILDACAGGGGKSIHIASLSKNSHIIANDLNEKRLNNLKQRAKRLQLSNISCVINPDLNKVQLPMNHFDKILVDAPCSGSGTFRKNPKIFNGIDRSKLKEYQKLQLDILESYSKFLKPGGVLIYATCSIFEIENEVVIKDFLENNTNFTPYLFSNFLDEVLFDKLNIKSDDYKISMFPHRHKTDGFFISTLVKT